MRAFLGDVILVSEAGGEMGGEEEGVWVIQFLMDILKEDGGLGETEEMEPFLLMGERALAGGVLMENVGVFEGRGRSPAQLGAHAAEEGEEMDGLLLTLGALAGVLWLLVPVTEKKKKVTKVRSESPRKSLSLHQR